jgi:hypothetical protein
MSLQPAAPWHLDRDKPALVGFTSRKNIRKPRPYRNIASGSGSAKVAPMPRTNLSRGSGLSLKKMRVVSSWAKLPKDVL